MEEKKPKKDEIITHDVECLQSIWYGGKRRNAGDKFTFVGELSEYEQLTDSTHPTGAVLQPIVPGPGGKKPKKTERRPKPKGSGTAKGKVGRVRK